MLLPFRTPKLNIPTRVEVIAAKYDGGFLENLWHHLNIGEPVKGKDNFKRIFTDFAETGHHKAMAYSDRHGKGWFPCNFSYENIFLLNSGLDFGALMYHVTGWVGMGGTEGGQVIGDIKRNYFISPVKLDEENKGFVINSPLKNGYNSVLYLGDRGGEEIAEMPVFRGMKPVPTSWLMPSFVRQPQTALLL